MKNSIYYKENKAETPEEIKENFNLLDSICYYNLIDSYILEDDEDGKVIETTTKFEFNLGFAKVSKSIKKIKK